MRCIRRCVSALLFSGSLTSLNPRDAFAQQKPTLRIEQTTLVSGAVPETPHAEPFLAVNRRDPRQLLATAIVPGSSWFGTNVYRSIDAGRSWALVKFDSTRWTAGVDPIVYFDGMGAAFFSALSGGFTVLHSDNGGATWDPAIQVPGVGYDRQYLAFDETRGPYAGRIYAAGTVSLRDIAGRRHASIAVSYSQNGGRTFTSPRIITPDASEEFWTIADPVVLPSGRLLVGVAGVTPMSGGMTAMSDSVLHGHIRVITSDDGSASFSTPVTVAEFTNATGRRGMLGRTTVRAAADSGSLSPYRGSVYLAWPELIAGRYDIVVARSTDDGRTWRNTRPVDAGVGDQTNPAITVNNDGVVAVLWNDRRESGESSCFNVRASVSTDGGEHFGASTMLSSTATCPEARGNWTPTAMSIMNAPMNAGVARPAIQITALPTRFLTGGETQGLEAAPDGSFHALWLDGSSGVMQLRWSRLRASGSVTRAQETGAPATVPTSTSFDPLRAVRIEVDQPELDFTTHTVSVRVQLINNGKADVPATVDLVLERVSGALENLRATNADSGGAGIGARWRMSAASAELSLRPGQRSTPRLLRFSFVAGPPSTTGAMPALFEFSIRPPGR